MRHSEVNLARSKRSLSFQKTEEMKEDIIPEGYNSKDSKDNQNGKKSFDYQDSID